ELAGRSGQLLAERQTITAQHLEWEFRNGYQQQAVEAARADSVTVNARVEELAARAAFRATQISEAETRVESLRRAASEAGESVLHLHGEQKQAEEALVHQKSAQERLEKREAELLESSIRIRDDAERAAQDWQNTLSLVDGLEREVAAQQNRLAQL